MCATLYSRSRAIHHFVCVAQGRRDLEITPLPLPQCSMRRQEAEHYINRSKPLSIVVWRGTMKWLGFFLFAA